MKTETNLQKVYRELITRANQEFTEAREGDYLPVAWARHVRSGDSALRDLVRYLEGLFFARDGGYPDEYLSEVLKAESGLTKEEADVIRKIQGHVKELLYLAIDLSDETEKLFPVAECTCLRCKPAEVQS